MNCCNHNKMPRPVRGNAFNVAVMVVARRIDGTVIDDFALTSEAVLKITYGTSSTEKEYTIIGQNVAVIHFDGKDAAGIYGVEFTGEWSGEPWRFAVPVVFQVVELTTQGWLPQDGIIYEPTYEVDAEIVIAGGGGGGDVQADWTETDPDSPAYIQHKPTIYTQAETDALLAGKQNELVSGQNIKTINGNSIVGSGNLTIPTGLSVAYEVVDTGMLYLDQTNTYYEVPSTVYTALKAVWDAGKVPVLKGNLDGLESNMGAFTTTVSLDNSVGAFRFFAHNSNPGRRTTNFSSWGRILSDGGRIYITEEHEVVQTVQAGSTNPVSGGGVKTYVDNALAGTAQQVHTNEVAATLSPEIVHIFTGTTDTLAITLTATTDALSHLYTLILTTGTTPAVTIQVSDSTAIIYPDDYAIEAGTTYEISVLYANGKYYLRYVTYQEA